METLFHLFDGRMIDDIVTMLLHSLWQGILLAAGLWFFFKIAKPSSARIRYIMSFFTLLALMAAALLTFSAIRMYRGDAMDAAQINSQDPIPNDNVSAVFPDNTSLITTTSKAKAPPITTSARNDIHNNTVWGKLQRHWRTTVFMLYALGTGFMFMRIFVRLGGNYSLKKTAVSDNAPWRKLIFNEVATKVRVAKRVVLAVSDKIIIPCTIGFIKPVILLPATMLTGLDESQLRAILAHELMHIKRHDWLFNLVQMFVEAVLFFNPAVWWISKHIRLEREAVCDEGVVGQTQNAQAYARLLLDLAKLHHRPAIAAALGVKFASDGPGPISERIKRLVIPGHRSAGSRPGFIPSLVILCLLTAALVFLQRGTEGTLKYIGQHLSPQQRTEVMNQLSETYETEPYKTSVFDEANKIIVRGRLLTSDGNSLPIKTYENCQGKDYTTVDVHMQVEPYEQGHHYPKINLDGSFELQTSLSKFYIIVRPRQGYATSFFGPFEYEPGEVIEYLPLVLETGFTAKIQFINKQGQSIPNARITGGYPRPPEFNSWSHTIKVESDENGIAVVEHATDEWVNMTCEAPGYVKESKNKITLNPDKAYVWQLTPAPPTTIHVVADEDGRPISHAAINLQGNDYWQIDSHYIDKPVFLTNEKGIIELTSLSGSETYLVLIHAPGYQRTYQHITGGGDITIRLKNFIPIKGKITGDLSGLREDEKGFFFDFSNVTFISENSTNSDWTGGNKVYVECIGDESFFQIDKYYGQRIDIRIGTKIHSINVDEDDISNVIINIPPLTSFEMKKIVFEFIPVDNTVNIPINGTFKLSFKDNPNTTYSQNHDIEIINGKAEVDIPVPNHISWKPSPKLSWFFYNGYENIDVDCDNRKTITCYPAGAIFGTITNPQENSSYAYMSLHAVKSPELDPRRSQSPWVEFQDNINLNPTSSFYIAPIPLGGEYGVSAGSGNIYWLSETVKLTEQNPICELNITLPTQLADIRGQLQDPSGKPLPSIRYTLDTDAPYGGRNISGDTMVTGLDGSIIIDGVNPDRSLTYNISFDAKGYIRKNYKLKVWDFNRILLEKGHTVTGIVIDEETNQPMPGATINFSPKDSINYLSFKVMTNANGEFIANQFGESEYYYSLTHESRNIMPHGLLDPTRETNVELIYTKNPRH